MVSIGEGGIGEGGAGGMPEPDVSGYLFALDNATEGAEIVVFTRELDGSLTPQNAVPTGGSGTGGDLGSQGALLLSPDEQYLYAVNAGSNEISSFRVYDDHLALVDIAASGGGRPISVTASADRVYVVNAEGSGSVSGFAVDDGIFSAIPGATRPLSTEVNPTGAAQVSLNPAGDFLVVSEKATNNIVTYAVAADGSLGPPVVTASQGQTPFGFTFTAAGQLVVSEAFGGGDGLSAASSYEIANDGTLTVVSSSVPSGGSAACWMVLANSDSVGYVTNTASNTVSGYHVAADGALTLFADDGVTADLGDAQAPIDMIVAADGEFLYVLNATADTISGFGIASTGALSSLGASTAVPAATVGLAGF